MLSLSYSVALLVVVFAVSAFVSLAFTALGVWGMEKLQNRRITDLELDIEALRASLKSFVKTVSGRMGAEKKAAMGSIEDQAKLRLAEGGDNSDASWLAGGKV